MASGPRLQGSPLCRCGGSGQAADGRDYAFRLSVEAADASTTSFAVTAANPLVRLMVPPMRVTFATDTRLPIRYEGRVPPLFEGRPFEARVEYHDVAARYR